MIRVGTLVMAVSLALPAGCSLGDDGPASDSSTSSSTATTGPGVEGGPTSSTVFRAPTSCDEAPQLPACEPGHDDP